jgi:hypothetical protein
MRKTFLLLWLVPVLAFSQLTVTGGSSLDLDTLLPIIADSSKWTDGSTVNAIKPRDAKTVEADSAKVGALEVTGNARFNGNVTMVTTAGEQVRIGPGSDAAPELSSADDTNTGIRFIGSDVITAVSGGVSSIALSSNYMRITPITAYFGMRATGTKLYSDANNQLDMRDATDLNIINVYNTYAGGTSFERGFMRATATAFEFGHEKGSTGGVARPVKILSDNIVRVDVGIDTASTVTHYGLYGDVKEFVLVKTLAGFTGATMTITNAIPSGSIVLGVAVRVTTAITGDAGFTGFSVGDGIDVDRWGANLNPAKDETSDLTDCTITSIPIYAAATSIVFSAVGNDFTAGGVRVVIVYKTISPPSG